MISIKNIEKFIDDHPELELDKIQVLKKARDFCDEGVIMGGAVEQILGEHKEIFFQEISTDFEHIKLGMEDMTRKFG